MLTSDEVATMLGRQLLRIMELERENARLQEALAKAQPHTSLNGTDADSGEILDAIKAE